MDSMTVFRQINDSVQATTWALHDKKQTKQKNIHDYYALHDNVQCGINMDGLLPQTL
jgi:hypothetical protein